MALSTHETTCLFCSLCCPAGVAVDALGFVEPDYPGHTSERHRGLCFRGHYLSDLAAHASRFHEATVREGGEERQAMPAEALRDAGRSMPNERSATAVVVDGNATCEEILGAVRAARDGLGVQRVTIFVPPTDEAVLRGVAAGAAARLTRESVAECDVVLAVGDPFATQPVVASPVLDALSADRRHRLVNIDPIRGRTARYATDFVQVAPGGEAAALAGLLMAVEGAAVPEALNGRDIEWAAERAGVSTGALESAARAVQDAKRLGVLVSLPEGRCAEPAAVGALAAMVAAARGGRVLPLTIYGNAEGACRLAAALGTTPLSQLLDDVRAETVKTLIVLGTDLLSAVPDPCLAGLDVLLASAALPSATAERARFVVPSSFWFEQGGTVVGASGMRQEVAQALSAPRGALSAVDVLVGLGAPGGVGAQDPADDLAAQLADPPAHDLGAALGDPDQWGVAVGDGQIALLSRADAKGFADGSLTIQLSWPALMEPGPVLYVDPSAADAMGDGPATLRRNGHALAVAVKASDDVPAGVGVLAACFPAVRPLFGCEGGPMGPGVVALEKNRGND